MSRPIFENVVCSRCNGTGKFSFNMMHGSKCYGCGGVGCTLTKRGRVALSFLDDLRVAQADEIKVGDLIKWDMFTFCCWAKVESIELKDGLIQLRGIRGKTGEAIGQNCTEKTVIRRGFSAEEKQRQIAMALAYQATLTKAGLVSKRFKSNIKT